MDAKSIQKTVRVMNEEGCHRMTDLCRAMVVYSTHSVGGKRHICRGYGVSEGRACFGEVL